MSTLGTGVSEARAAVPPAQSVAAPAAPAPAAPAKKSIFNTMKNAVRPSTKVGPVPPPLLPAAAKASTAPAKKSIFNTMKNAVRPSTKVGPLPSITSSNLKKSFVNKIKNTVRPSAKVAPFPAPPADLYKNKKSKNTVDTEFDKIAAELQVKLRKVLESHKSVVAVNRSTVNTRKLRKNMEKVTSNFIESLPKPSTRRKGRFWHLLEKPHESKEA